MSAPAAAHAVTCVGILIEAAMISVSMLWIAKISAISLMRLMPSIPMSSSLPTNGLTYVAPALAASRAYAAEKISVTFVLTPMPERIFVAFRPSAHRGILITMFG